ncbi:unnamed protein product [Parnassius mnemosyne]|uniref:RNA-directed DNA polymerase n=1 Tax=Parnassius mnemosyne TaxID=213953 RepID=A0AAV1KU95_9NEOP
MSLSCGPLPIFNHELQSWKIFKTRITQWFIANDINASNDAAGVKRRAILLSAFADGTFKLASDLAVPKDLQQIPFEDILTILDTHFTPKQVGFSERHNFYAATQQPTESPSQWAARLRGLTVHCQFSNVEEALRDRFIMGMLPGVEKEKLYTQDISGITLAKAVELAENVRSARAIAASAAATTTVVTDATTDQLYKIGQDSKCARSRQKCAVCGYTSHSASECRFANYRCKKCNMKGHLRRMCKKVNYVNTSEVGEDSDDGKIFNIRSVRGEPLVETVTVNGIDLEFQIDSGSAVTVISERTYKLHFHDIPLSFTKKKLVSYTGEVLGCAGRVQMSLQWRGKTCMLDVYVVRNGGPPLLGRDFIARFELQLTPIHYCKQIQNEIETLHIRYPQVFSGELGCFNKYEIKLTLKENVKPLFFKARPIAFALRDKIDSELKRLVDLGVLRPVSYSEYASPIVPVLKRDGSVRICADYSVSLNKQLVIDQYPLPTVNELFSKLHGGQYFTKLDLSMAYNQFCLNEESQKLTCINTHRGLFSYTRLVFGLASAPAIFQRAMEYVLAGLNGVHFLLDDILITGKDDAEHLDRLHQVLQRLQDAGLTLQKNKCSFFKDEISYLGYVINRNGLKKSPEKVKAILEAPIPTNVNQLQSFLGLVNYYRGFVPNASSILSPLYQLLKKGIKWKWSKVENEAFDNIRKILSSEQVLTHFNPNETIILTVDASPNGLGAILSQKNSAGIEKPLSFASRTLNNAEKRYSQIQKEATAIVFGVRRFHQYLYGRSTPFILRTDHKPLLSIFGPYKGIPEVSANRLQRYALFLSGYNYTIEYVKSSDNRADYLSRFSLPDADASSGGTGGDSNAGYTETADIDDRAAYVNFVVKGAIPITLQALRDAINKDRIMKKVIHYVLEGWPKKVNDSEIKPYSLCKLELSYENGCLMRGHKIVIPGSLRDRVISELHTSHMGIVKTKAEARSRFWFPGIDGVLERMIGSCEICMQLRAAPPRVHISPWKYPADPFRRIHLDFLGPINGHMYLVIVDAYSKWVEVCRMNTTCASIAVIDKLYEFMSRFGLPETIVTDNGTSFCSREFLDFCHLNGITHITSPAYHPASNGQAESYVKVIKRGIKSSLLSSNNVRECNLNLLKYIFDYRNSVHSTTGLSPAQIVFGRKLRSRLDILKPAPSPPLSSSLAKTVRSKQCSQVKSHGGKEKMFLPGQYVLYKKYSNKNKFNWCKGVIIQKLGKIIYLIRDSLLNTVVKKHVNQIILYKGTINASRPWELDILSPDTPGSSVSTPASCVPILPPDLQCHDKVRELGEGDGHEDRILTPMPAAETSNENLTNSNDSCRQSRSPSHITVTQGVRRPKSSDDEEEVSRAQEYQAPLKRNRPKVDYKKFF